MEDTTEADAVSYIIVIFPAPRTNPDSPQVSLTSSCEIVEALEDAVNDSPEAGDKESSPPVELSWLADGSDSMTSSQYAQVIFRDIRESYPIDLDLEVSYTLTSFIEPGHGDRVALYKLPYLQVSPHSSSTTQPL